MTSTRERYNNRRDVRREIAQKPELGIELTNAETPEINQTTAPGLEPPPSLYNVNRGTSPASEGELTVPLRFPNREDMAVHMVPSNLINDLENCRSDEDLISGGFWTIIGALLGIILSWVPDFFVASIPSHIHYIRLTMMIMLILFSIAVGLYWRNLNVRTKNAQLALQNYQS